MSSASAPSAPAGRRINSPFQVLTASLIGTTIEFFDFYVYATAAVLVFPTLFFPNSDPTTALLASFATFSIAFFARPVGALVFGHYGDRIGRKKTLIAALLTMGISTVVIGLLPSYETAGVVAPLLLALCRFGQGFGLGGEWGGALLLATENATEKNKSWYGMFPQLGAPVGLFLASGAFWALMHFISQEALLSWGWRIPFLASAALIAVGLWVRFSITETPEFARAAEKREQVAVPAMELFRHHKRSLFLGIFLGLMTFVMFYICSAYLLSYNVKTAGMPFIEALTIQLYSSLFFGGATIIAGLLGDKLGRRRVLIGTALATGIFAFLVGPLLTSGDTGIIVFAMLGMTIFGVNYGVMGTALAEPFPTRVRYTGSSIAFNVSGILGASLAPYIATWLQLHYGIQSVGYYLLAATLISLYCMVVSPANKL
ncbi:MFS transporter [Bordetella avium]|uniref:Probable transporter n=1 Tax=Bordetella avium (strain 197N) TaxID=360910 RepID=Q2L0R5_BORA1|nr:MFS transporter [Bordetella avium]AZY49195.1 MFS transporter [Bordetella avium]AZY52548.1 MFS transporter [Bordetella avium]RIQ36062.1 MFS transporter [Bordetella avium]RIQ40110.1 MFS transporter [Bordetella avium]RIQ41727.1 MFS transporter [Bordetella avium]